MTLNSAELSGEYKTTYFFLIGIESLRNKYCVKRFENIFFQFLFHFLYTDVLYTWKLSVLLSCDQVFSRKCFSCFIYFNLMAPCLFPRKSHVLFSEIKVQGYDTQVM